MTNDNVTVEQVCEVLNRYPKAEAHDEDGLTILNNQAIADRILTAHRREVAELNKRLEHVVEDSNRICGLCEPSKKILELRECLKEACRYRCGKCNAGNFETESHFCGNYCDTIKRWHKALEGANDEVEM